jgi:CBS domain containing-hemolysin-like protein
LGEWISGVMNAIKIAMLPLVLLLHVTGSAALRLLGIKRSAAAHTREDLQFIVQESVDAGEIPQDAARIMQELFDFSSLTAEQALIPRVRVVGIPLGADPAVIRKVLVECCHTRYPVFTTDLDHVIGMVHIKDLLNLLIRGAALTQDVVREVPFVPLNMTLDRLLETMRAQSTQLAIVMDEYGGMAGILTVEDLFEELVGYIDEGAKTLPPLSIAGEDVRASGFSRLDEVSELLGMDVGHETVETVSGLVLSLLGRPPEVGDAITHRHARFVVTSIEGHGVGECHISRLPGARTEPSEDSES